VAAAAAANSDTQAVKDCYYDCTGMVTGGIGQWGTSISRGIKGMEGEYDLPSGCLIILSAEMLSVGNLVEYLNERLP